MERITIHKDFRLQEQSFNHHIELIEFSKSIASDVSNFFEEWFNTNDFIEVKTSGSTGTPKVIKLQKKHLINSALATGDFFGLPQKTTALLCMSSNFIAGKMMLVRAIVLGWHLDVVETTSSPLEGTKKHYDFSAMVPMQLYHSLEEIHKIKKLIVGGGVISRELLHQIKNVSTEIFATYGMTETVTHIAVKRLNNYCHTKRSEASVYKALPNVTLFQDSRNCLVIEAPKVASEKVVTNDIVELISDSEFKWLGRFDNIINSGGIKLVPEQIEEKLSKIINKRFFVTGIPDEVLGEKLVLVVEELVTERSRSDNKKEILQKVKQLTSLSKFQQPKEIYFIPKFIETQTGKINRKATLDLL